MIWVPFGSKKEERKFQAEPLTEDDVDDGTIEVSITLLRIAKFHGGPTRGICKAMNRDIGGEGMRPTAKSFVSCRACVHSGCQVGIQLKRLRRCFLFPRSTCMFVSLSLWGISYLKYRVSLSQGHSSEYK